MPRTPQTVLMPKKKRSSAARVQQPGGPGAMDALRRAQEKLKAMGVKLYKWTPPDPKAGKKPAAGVADAPSPKGGEGKPAGGAKTAGPAAPNVATPKPRAKGAPKAAAPKAEDGRAGARRGGKAAR